jgi:hypothetical protein
MRRPRAVDTKFVNHDIRVMKNVTISMDEATLAWVRIEAAKAGMSVSRWIARILSGRQDLDIEKAAASARIEAFLDSGPHFALSENGKITIDRDELYDDGRFRRFDHPALQPGSALSGQAEAFDGVAEEPFEFGEADPKRSGPE